jgi:hypothetical protein
MKNKHNKKAWLTIDSTSLSFIALILTVVGLHIQSDNRSYDFKEVVRLEMKDFHERLLKIEMERK